MTEFPYLAIGPKLPATAELHNFSVGHPALLSFAKLLLEIDFGQTIDLDINPCNSQNLPAWGQLLSRVDRLAEERSDSYLQAIRSCLLVHDKIAKALRTQGLGGKKADSTIRKKLYKEVVRKLERGLAESIPRPAHKRQRSESPPSDRWDGSQATGSSKTTILSMGRERLEQGYFKRQRIPEPQQWQLPSVANLALGDPNGLYDQNMPAEYSAKCSISRRVIASSCFAISSGRASSRKDFEVAIICALRLEYDAISYLFDEFWDEDGDQYGKALGDTNHYTTGRMGNYNIVLALLPHMGKANAASAAASMRSSYSSLRLVLLIGVCGAAPRSQDDEILLGDVVISKTIVQYDFGRRYPDKFVRKSTVDENIGRANKDVRNLVAIFETDRGRDRLEKRTAYFLQQLQTKAAQARRRGKYDYPGAVEDKLFQSTYRHKHHRSPRCICYNCTSDLDPVCNDALGSLCADLGCDDAYLVARDRLTAKEQDDSDAAQPAVHFGAIASGDAVIKSAMDRDRLSTEAGVIAFEMEGAGVWDELPSIIVKGVCDYADSHKHKAWQNFAAATSASTCKAILERYIRADT
ncbi:hypothetical protein Neosp_007926 [[Neocosmospora] mangrovei]